MKLIIFDLDGVLVEAKQIHFNALNMALNDIDPKFKISWQDHLKTFDGLKTYDKLKVLSNKGLPDDKTLHDKIFDKKQEYTLESLSKLNKNTKLINIFNQLKSNSYTIACCSNSVNNTVELTLNNLGLDNFFDLKLSNENVKNAKPHPEIYWKAMTVFGAYPSETLILEDSPIGLKAAYNSGAKVLRVKNPDDFDFEMIENAFKSNMNIKEKWVDKKLNILIPMAGAGTRFEKAGYTFPKPLIEVNGKPMIQVVIDNLNIDANYIFVVQKSHNINYNLEAMLNLIVPGCKIVEVDGVTEGAACTCLLARDLINNDNPLFFANSDQFAEWNSSEFMYKMNESEADGGIVTFESTHPKWSFAEVVDNVVTRVAEKDPISTHATVGFYYWKKGSDFIKFSEQMINKNIRVNNEFYVCPVFNEAIQDNKKILNFQIDKMWGLGTPEDLEYFIKNY
jgi:HAD superfamily hydrolase (TIGR01509 family)